MWVQLLLSPQSTIIGTMSYSQLSREARNVVSMFSQATTLEVIEGLNWYPNAHQIAYKLGQRFNTSTDKAAGVLCALSPLNKWPTNVLNAETLIKAWAYGTAEDAIAVKCSTPPLNKEKAVRILQDTGESIESILHGPKVNEFFNSITRPEVNDVCIDGHAYCIFMGVRLPVKEVPAIGKRLRQTIKQGYRDATSFINEELNEEYLNSDIQAITWVTYKRIHNV